MKYLNYVAMVAAALSILTHGLSPAQTYKAIGEYKLSGSGGRAIAVDTEGRRLFVAGDAGIQVLNADTGASIRAIPLKNATDVLLIPVMNGEEPGASTKGFASGNGEVISFSLADMKPSSTIKLPSSGTSSLCYDDDAKTVEAVSSGGYLMTINADTNKVLATAKLPTGSGQIACGTLSHVYVADTAANVVHVLNHESGKNDGDIPMMTGHKPTGMALDTKGRRLFVSCEDGVIEVIDTDAGFTFIELGGGQGPAGGTFVWTPQGKSGWKAAAFLAQGDGTLSGVRMNAYINYSLGGSYKLTAGLSSVAYDAKTHHLFMTASHDGSPVVVVAGY
jgi:hypothetical protein